MTYHATGLCRDEVDELSEGIRELTKGMKKSPWPPSLGLTTSVIVTLTYLCRTRAQVEIGEAFGVSQSTASRAIAAITPLLEQVLSPGAPSVEDPHVTVRVPKDPSGGEKGPWRVIEKVFIRGKEAWRG